MEDDDDKRPAIKVESKEGKTVTEFKGSDEGVAEDDGTATED